MSGMAQAVCAALDSMHWDGVVGTLAGDDTIFILIPHGETRRSIWSGSCASCKADGIHGCKEVCPMLTKSVH